MDSETFNKLVEQARKRQDNLLIKKGADYTRHDPDRLSNFKRMAAAIGISPLKVWAVYAGKHWDAIMAFVKTGKVESEAIEGRLDDMQNYLYLLEGLLKEENEKYPEPFHPLAEDNTNRPIGFTADVNRDKHKLGETI